MRCINAHRLNFGSVRNINFRSAAAFGHWLWFARIVEFHYLPIYRGGIRRIGSTSRTTADLREEQRLLLQVICFKVQQPQAALLACSSSQSR